MGCELALLPCCAAVYPARSELEGRPDPRKGEKIVPAVCPVKAGSSYFLLLPRKEQLWAPGRTLYNELAINKPRARIVREV